jgi:glycosyltransferase involved in cell wall biosynthesis
MSGLSVFLPMYNERENIADAVIKLVPALSRLTVDTEIVVVDDGSTDGSSDVMRSLAARYPGVRVVVHPVNLGYGAALASGFSAATKDRIFYTDSDLPIDYADIARAWDIMETGGVDAVIGYRLNREPALKRKLYTVVYNFLVRRLFGVRVRDVNFSFKMVTREVRDSLRLTARSGFIDGQLLHQLTRNGFRIREVGVRYVVRERGTSSFDSLSAVAANLKEMLTYWWQVVRQRPMP